MNMKKYLILLTVCILAGCSSLRKARIVEHAVHDTLYLNRIQYDSIYVDNQHLSEYHPSYQRVDGVIPDTMVIREIIRENHYRLMHDTIRISHIDSIPVIHEVEVVKHERYVPAIYKWSLTVCIILLCMFCTFVVIRFLRV